MKVYVGPLPPASTDAAVLQGDRVALRCYFCARMLTIEIKIKFAEWKNWQIGQNC